MAQNHQDVHALTGTNSPLAHAQTNVYVETQKKADFNRNLGQYMFWGATTVLAGVLALSLGFGAALPFLKFGVISAKVGTLLVGGAVALGTFLGSLHFSKRATEMSERANVLYSDIDSQLQSKRMVQAFAKAQSTEAGSDVPFTRRDGKSWANSVGGQMQRQSNWADRVNAQSAAEDARALNNLKSR